MNRWVRVTFEQKVFAVLMLLPGAGLVWFAVDEFDREGLAIAVVCFLAAAIYFGVVWSLQLRHDLRAALERAVPAGDDRVEAWPLTVVRAWTKSSVASLVMALLFAAGATAAEGILARLVVLPFALSVGIGFVALFAALRIDTWQRAHGRLLVRDPAWGRAALDPRRLAYVETDREESTLPVVPTPRD